VENGSACSVKLVCLRERETERERKNEAKRGSNDEREKVSEWGNQIASNGSM
jgi:hypothetical protein